MSMGIAGTSDARDIRGAAGLSIGSNNNFLFNVSYGGIRGINSGSIKLGVRVLDVISTNYWKAELWASAKLFVVDNIGGKADKHEGLEALVKLKRNSLEITNSLFISNVSQLINIKVSKMVLEGFKVYGAITGARVKDKKILSPELGIMLDF